MKTFANEQPTDLTRELLAQTARQLQIIMDSSPVYYAVFEAEEPGGPATEFLLKTVSNKLVSITDLNLTDLSDYPMRWLDTLLWGEQTPERFRQIYMSRQGICEEVRPAGHSIAVSVIPEGTFIILTGLSIAELKEARTSLQGWLSEVLHTVRLVHQLIKRASFRHDKFLKAVTHDLRGFVGIVNSATQLIHLAGSEAEQYRMFEMLLNNMRRITQLLTDLREYIVHKANHLNHPLE